jgi:predicted KAP-like P-loop ATPase
MFNPDQPIKSHKEDLLGRASFSRSLGNTILKYKEKDSVVIGLFGEWGSGKTSIINLTLEKIEKISSAKQDTRPVIVKFNPWNFSDQHQLISQFFKQLSAILKRTDYASDAKKAGEKLETYAEFFEPLALVPAIGTVALVLSKVFKRVGIAAKGWGKMKEADLNSTKKTLNDLLYKLPRKIIIVIDDIDRLNNAEIRQVFQLVKSLGDFSNTIYLLAFEKQVVINALSKVQEGSGSDYLEKVVQVPFEIPLISKQEVERLLFSRLDVLIKDIPESRWDQTYWGNIYQSGLRYFFKNIRDVTRYINSLGFSLEMVKNEVNPIDFLAITGLQVFIPEIYYGIRDNKDIFTGSFDSYYGNEASAKEQARKRCDEILSRTTEYSQDVLKDFLQRLFPKLESIYGNTNYGSDWLENWRRTGRVCSPDIFDVFFSLAIPKGELSLKEMETILSLSNDGDAFGEALLKLNQDGRIVRFLERLEDYTEKNIFEANIGTVIKVLIDIGDLFPEDDSGFFAFGTHMRIVRICYQLSRRFAKQEQRYTILKEAIEQASKSLYTIVEEVVVQGQQHGKFTEKKTLEPEEKRTITGAQLAELERLACKKIAQWADDGRLSKHRRLVSILYSWMKWEGEAKVRQFVENMIKSDQGLLDFIAASLNKSRIQGYSDYVAKINWHINIKNVSDFVNVIEIVPRLRNILSNEAFKKLDEHRQLAVRTFLDTYDGKIKERF